MRLCTMSCHERLVLVTRHLLHNIHAIRNTEKHPLLKYNKHHNSSNTGSIIHTHKHTHAYPAWAYRRTWARRAVRLLAWPGRWGGRSQRWWSPPLPSWSWTCRRAVWNHLEFRPLPARFWWIRAPLPWLVEGNPSSLSITGVWNCHGACNISKLTKKEKTRDELQSLSLNNTKTQNTSFMLCSVGKSPML